jgi:hypothetical protein
MEGAEEMEVTKAMELARMLEEVKEKMRSSTLKSLYTQIKRARIKSNDPSWLKVTSNMLQAYE